MKYRVFLKTGYQVEVTADNFAISPNGDLSLYDAYGGVQAFAADTWQSVERTDP